MGACTGLALLATIGFLLGHFLGLTPVSIGVAAAVLLLPLMLLVKPEYHRQISDELHFKARGSVPAILFYIALIAVLGWTFAQNMVQRPDGIYTGVDHNLGDLPFHVQAISSFVYAQNIPVEDPTYAGVRFTYPVLADFLTAMLVRCGAPVAAALWLQNMVLVLAFVGLLHHWTCVFTGNRLAGLFAPLLVIFSGGLGWWLLMQNLRESDGGLVTLLAHLPRDYTIADSGIFRWGNSVTTLLVTQRSFLFGLPLAVGILYLWWTAMEPSASGSGESEASASSTRRMLAAGTWAGLLPLVHTHGFLVVFGVAVCLALVFRSFWRLWRVFLATALVVALPEVFWLFHGSAIATRTFIGWQTGWDHADYNPVWFWFVNTGFFIPLLLAAILWRRYAVSRRAAWFYAPFAFCFLIPNFLKLSPWIWDNIKFLFYWYVASVPLVAFVLARMWEERSRRRWLAAGLLASLTLSGGLDILRVMTRTIELQEFTTDGIQMAKLINLLAPPRSLVLHGPTWDSPVYLTGRRSVLGYSGWSWSRGLEISQREAEIRVMYSGGPAAKDLLQKYHVEYVLLGPSEKSLGANESFWASCAKLAQIGQYQLYKPDCS